jgi:hypothetical protein
LPVLAGAIPLHVSSVTVIADDDPDGRRFACELAHRVAARKIEVRVTRPNLWERAA